MDPEALDGAGGDATRRLLGNYETPARWLASVPPASVPLLVHKSLQQEAAGQHDIFCRTWSRNTTHARQAYAPEGPEKKNTTLSTDRN